MPKRTNDYREGLLQSLLDPIAAAQYVNAALEDSDEMFLIALRDVAEARQMAKVANDAGLSRESIYRTLSDTGNPRYSSLTRILKAVGLRLAIEPDIQSPIIQGHELEEHSLLASNFKSAQNECVRVTDISKYLEKRRNTIQEMRNGPSQPSLIRARG
jgi:probable addiction module antidote protein